MTVTLVIGAAASGKSAYAESLCLGHDGPRVYLATMEPFGEEGARRIARHRALRELRLNAYMNDIFRLSTIKMERGTSYPFARSVSFAISLTL